MNLKEDQKRYRVFMEDSWAAETDDGKTAEKWRYYELRGMYGSLYPYSRSELALLVTSSIIAMGLRRRRKWAILEAGDKETVFLVPNKEWQDAAVMIRARKRRTLSPEAAQKGAERLAAYRLAAKKPS